MRRRYILFFFIILVLATFLTINTFFISKTSQRKLNVIVISVDTLRADHMGVYGYDKDTTPNIDAWAKDAVIFTNMHTVVPSTYPSFVTLMTGLSPFESKIFSNWDVLNDKLYGDNEEFQKISRNTPLWAEIFKKNGYKTAAYITNGVLQGKETGLSRGFDVYKIQTRGFDRSYVKGINILSTNKEYKKYKNTVNESADWIHANKKDNFFLWVHIMDPHSPYIPDNEFVCATNKKYCAQIQKEGLGNLEKRRNTFTGCQNKSLSSEQVELFKTLYDGSIKSVDKMIGIFLERIKKEDILDNTIILLYGDHGESFDHDVYFEHINDVYESNTHIPFIIKYPYPEKIRIDDLFDNTVIFSTILKSAGIITESEGGLFDKSFASLKPPKEIYAVNHNLTKYAITDDTYKYIYSLPSACLYNNFTEELYAIKKDPHETKNIYSEKKAKKLKEKLFSYLEKFNLPQQQFDSDNASQNKDIIETLKSLGY